MSTFTQVKAEDDNEQEQKPQTKRQHVLSIPIASDAYTHLHKLGIRCDAERSGLNKAGIGTDDAELAVMRRGTPRNEIPKINEELAGPLRANYRGVDKEQFETGKPSSECLANLKKELEASAAIDLAMPVAAELEPLADMALDAWAEGAQIEPGLILRGGREFILPTLVEQVSVIGRAIASGGTDAKGHALPHVETPVFAGASVPVPNLGWLIRYSKTVRDELKSALIAEWEAQIGDATRIPLADRDRLKAEAAQRILVARRQLEAAIIDEEFDGKRPHRPADTPWHVLLWVEPDTTKPALHVVADNTRRTQNPDGTTTGETYEVPPVPGSAPPTKTKRMVNPGDEPTETEAREPWEE